MYSTQQSLGRLPILLMALGCFFWFGYQWCISYGSLKWPEHTGTISEVKIESQSRSRSSSRIYSPRVFYHFVHDHVSYEGSELLNSSNSLQVAQQSAAMWQHNQRLQIYYNPHNPQQNRLHQGEQLGIDGLLAGLALFVSICIGCSFCFDLKMR
jgi:hypothetical protein